MAVFQGVAASDMWLCYRGGCTTEVVPCVVVETLWRSVVCGLWRGRGRPSHYTCRCGCDLGSVDTECETNTVTVTSQTETNTVTVTSQTETNTVTVTSQIETNTVTESLLRRRLTLSQSHFSDRD